MTQNTGLFRDRSDHVESSLQIFELIKVSGKTIPSDKGGTSHPDPEIGKGASGLPGPLT